MTMLTDVVADINGKYLSSRDKVNAIEVEMAKQEQVSLRVEHLFSEGVYSRILYIPKGIILTGHIHKYSNLNIMTKGAMDVLVDEEIKRIRAPFIVVSPAGTKRIAIALEDTVWITIHGTHETDVTRIEQHFIAHSEQEYLDFVSKSNELKEEKQLLLFDDGRYNHH